MNILRSVALGFQPAMAVVAWLRSCSWPEEDPISSSLPIGISWPEIALAVMLEMGGYLPVKRKMADTNEHHLLWLDTFGAARLHGVTLSEQGEQVSQLFKQVNKFLPVSAMPLIANGRVRSLYLLGDSQATTGLVRRPSWPSQQRVVNLMRGYLTGGRRLPELSLPANGQWQIDRACGQYARVTLAAVRTARKKNKTKEVVPICDR